MPTDFWIGVVCVGLVLMLMAEAFAHDGDGEE